MVGILIIGCNLVSVLILRSYKRLQVNLLLVLASGCNQEPLHLDSLALCVLSTNIKLLEISDSLTDINYVALPHVSATHNMCT